MNSKLLNGYDVLLKSESLSDCRCTMAFPPALLFVVRGQFLMMYPGGSMSDITSPLAPSSRSHVSFKQTMSKHLSIMTSDRIVGLLQTDCAFHKPQLTVSFPPPPTIHFPLSLTTHPLLSSGWIPTVTLSLVVESRWCVRFPAHFPRRATNNPLSFKSQIISRLINVLIFLMSNN